MTEHDEVFTLAELMKAEHEGLARSLDEVKEEIVSSDHNRSRVNDSIAHMVGLVVSHFRTEEQGGYMKDVVAQSPHLSGRVEMLEQEHTQLKEQLDKLQEFAQSGDESTAWWSQIRTDFERFATQLHAHEHAETQLVQVAYTQDIGSKD